MMKTRIALVSPYTLPFCCGNSFLAERLEGGLSKAGFEAALFNSGKDNPDDAVSFAPHLLHSLNADRPYEWLQKFRLGFLSVPEMLDDWYYRLAARHEWAVPSILGTPIRELGIRPELDIAMIGAGGLMGIRTGVSLLIGAVLDYFILAPIMIHCGD